MTEYRSASSDFDRRKFNKLTAAALGGFVAGTVGCGSEKPKENGNSTQTNVAAGEGHLCRGLNDCKGQGAGGKNECRGQGACATVEAHGCAGKNTCKGLGGCGENPAQNSCKGEGGCAVPLMASAWDTVRARMEEKWKEKEAAFGEAPAKE